MRSRAPYHYMSPAMFNSRRQTDCVGILWLSLNINNMHGDVGNRVANDSSDPVAFLKKLCAMLLFFFEKDCFFLN